VAFRCQPAALGSFKVALHQRVLGRDLEARLRYALARVLAQLERSDEAIAALEDALCCLRAETADARLLLVS
jgi:hypothetical protein